MWKDGDLSSTWKDRDLSATWQDGDMSATWQDGDLSATWQNGDLSDTWQDEYIPVCYVAGWRSGKKIFKNIFLFSGHEPIYFIEK